MEKSCRKCAPKASPRPLFNFGKQPKTAVAWKKLFKKSYILKEDYQKGNIINYSTSICLCKSGKCGKEGKKLQKFQCLENEKNFLDGIKTFSIVFEGLSFGEKIKIS